MNIDDALPVTVDEALRVTDEVDVDTYFARIMRALSAEVSRLEKELRAANHGAEINAEVNTQLAAKLRGEREPPHCPTCCCATSHNSTTPKFEWTGGTAWAGSVEEKSGIMCIKAYGFEAIIRLESIINFEQITALSDAAFRAGRQAAVADLRRYFEVMEK